MPGPSPLVEIKDGSAAYVTAVGGVNITPTNTIIIRLASQTDVDSWSIRCITTDNSSDADTVTAALTIDSVAKTATFTAPAAGKTYRFQSQVNSGVSRDGTAQSSYTTTFCLYTVKNGRRKLAADETTEGSSTFGWITTLNTLLDNVPSGSGDWDTGGGGGGSFQLFGVSNNFLTYQGGSAVGATGLNHVPTTGVISINRGIIALGTAVATFANAMLAGGTSATGFQLTRPVMLSPIVGGTSVFTGTDVVADGLSSHKPVSVVRQHLSIDATPTCIFAFNPTDEAITNVFAEINAVASGGAGAGSYARSIAIKMDGAIGTCSALENTRNQEFTHSGVGFTGIAIGSGIHIGVSGVTGFVNVKGTATGQIKWGATITLQTTSWV